MEITATKVTPTLAAHRMVEAALMQKQTLIKDQISYILTHFDKNEAESVITSILAITAKIITNMENTNPELSVDVDEALIEAYEIASVCGVGSY